MAVLKFLIEKTLVSQQKVSIHFRRQTVKKTMNELFLLSGDSEPELMNEERRAHPSIEEKFAFFSYSPNGYKNRKD